MIWDWFPVVIVTLAVVTAGCAYVPQKSGHEIDFDGTVERSDDSFQIDGQVEVDSGTGPTRNFSRVSVVLYETPGSVSERIRLGEMSTDSSVAPKRRPVNISRNTTPEYVLIESPDFWEDNRLVDGLDGVMAFRWNGDKYERYWVETKDERFDH